MLLFYILLILDIFVWSLNYKNWYFFYFSLLGGGGHKASHVKPVSPVGVVGLAGVVPNKTLMEMASKGKSLSYF